MDSFSDCEVNNTIGLMKSMLVMPINITKFPTKLLGRLLAIFEKEKNKRKPPRYPTKDMLKYHEELIAAFRDKVHTYIILKPGKNEPSIPAHRAVLVMRSKIFKTMLEFERCDVVNLSELNNEELESLVEFLYTGRLDEERMTKLLYPLSRAAHKYEIADLENFCEKHMLKSLRSPFDAIAVLEELLHDCSYLTAKEVTRTSRK